MATKITTADGWRELITKLEAERAELLAKAEATRASKAPHALAAAQGDTAARRALADADAEAGRLTNEGENLRMALQEARQRLAAAEADEAKAAELHRLSELRRLAKERQKMAEKVEAALAGFVASLVELEANSRAAELLIDDAATLNAAWRWQREIAALLLRDAEAAGVRLDLDRPMPAEAGETAATVTHLSAADWSDDDLERFANAGARR
jgi:hypothetical protein